MDRYYDYIIPILCVVLKISIIATSIIFYNKVIEITWENAGVHFNPVL